MKRIEVFEKAMNEGGSLKDYGINSTLFAAYRDCQETGNDNIDFNGVIWDYDIPEIVKALKENGSTFSSLIETLAAFEKEGIRMAGLTEVNATYSDWKTGKKARIPAIRMTL